AGHWLNQTKDQPSNGRLAAARFADKCERTAGRHAQIYSIHGFYGCRRPSECRPARDKMPCQSFDLQQGSAHARTSSNGAFTHRDQCFEPIATTGGGLSTQILLTKGQRAAKRQPGGISLISGSEPSIVASVSTRRSSRGIEARSPIV